MFCSVYIKMYVLYLISCFFFFFVFGQIVIFVPLFIFFVTINFGPDFVSNVMSPVSPTIIFLLFNVLSYDL